MILYLYEQGERTIPTSRPAQFNSSEVISLLQSLEVLDGYGYSAVGEALLNLNFEERRKFGKMTAGFRHKREAR